MNYYQFHIGDYRRDTSHLSLLEHGVYRQLLDQYYMTEQPISTEDAKVMRSLCVRSADEMQALANVLEDFFVKTDQGHIHKRCDIDIAAFHGKSESAREAANVRWAAARATLNANAMQTHSEGNATGMPTTNHKPLTINHKPRTTNKPSNEGFELFYEAYPKKVAKSAALKAWVAANINADMVPVILTDIATRSQGRDWTKEDGQFVPNPATYINQRRWEDVQNTPKSGGILAGAI